jgi:HPt (histidine-containing phosphotransfer) domain-containing protein
MDDYVSKPIRVEDLVGALSKSRPLGLEADGAQAELVEAETEASTSPPLDTYAPLPDRAGLDPTALENLLAVVGGEFDYLAELIDSFLDDAPKLLEELKQFVEDGDAAGVRRVAHSLKSNGADFGATTFAGLCKELEMMGKSGELLGAADLLPQIMAEYKKVEAALTAVRREGEISA